MCLFCCVQQGMVHTFCILLGKVAVVVSCRCQDTRSRENESYFGFVLIMHHTYTSVEHLLCVVLNCQLMRAIYYEVCPYRT